MEKATEKYLVDRIRELEEENKRYSALNGELTIRNGQLINTLAAKEETITELKKYFKLDNEEPRRIVALDIDGKIAGTIVWERDDGYTRLKQMVAKGEKNER